MKLILAAEIVRRLRTELSKAKRREIGGVLVGEHVEGETFRVIDVSVQRNGGTATHFVRDPIEAKKFLAKWFERTDNNFENINYLGEWHSHPLFEPLPSTEDHDTMSDLLHDPEVGANFLVLVIVRLRSATNIEMSATLFRVGCAEEPVDVVIEEEDAPQKVSVLRKIRLFLGWT